MLLADLPNPTHQLNSVVCFFVSTVMFSICILLTLNYNNRVHRICLVDSFDSEMKHRCDQGLINRNEGAEPSEWPQIRCLPCFRISIATRTLDSLSAGTSSVGAATVWSVAPCCWFSQALINN